MTETVETELVDSDQIFAPRKVRVSYCCEQCGHKWKKTYTAAPKVDPPCPNKSCADKARMIQLERQIANLTQMLEQQRAPAQVGANVTVKAVDATADIVMQDYGMTNLKDNVRAGEAVAPKLEPKAQSLADNFFGGAGMKSRGLNPKQIELLGRRAISGAYRDMAVSPKAIYGGAASGQSPLRVVRTEPTGKR